MQTEEHMNVASMLKKDRATIDDARAWLVAMTDKGKFTQVAGKYRVASLDALASLLGPDDGRSAQVLLANVESLANDWARKNTADGKTARNIRGSVRTSLETFLAYLEDPVKAQAKLDALATPRKAKEKAEVAESKSPELPLGSPVPPAPAAASATPQPVRSELRSYPLGDGRTIQFTVPENFRLRELAKFSCHMATYAVDFDPNRPTQGTVVAMVKVDDAQKP